MGYRLCQEGTQRCKEVGDLAGAYSRRINIQHRLAYEVFTKERTVCVLRMWTHYE
ncbi:MAG: type II toxin-antitoxin system YoeB family toxin [Rhodoferax sp.]|nr:type II toxin-antitoxin system YoeB family toxin [Rhodoferax sp.]MDO8320980.1 type II toxin-antitoxin system YoeB family toxin [Rhodoferax sp.]MDP2678630.1 type II toxin-antitoxin system YoeB family toxin [Rhodoferax sp.]